MFDKVDSVENILKKKISKIKLQTKLRDTNQLLSPFRIRFYLSMMEQVKQELTTRISTGRASMQREKPISRQ